MKKNNNLSAFNSLIKSKEKSENQSNKVVIYTRISSVGQTDNFSLSNQDKTIRDFCKEKGFKIVKEFGNIHESAKNDESRKEFNNMLTFVKKPTNEIFGIVVFAIDRFSRSGGRAIGILENLVREKKIHLIEAKSGIDSTSDRGYLTILDALLQSKKENVTKQERVIPGMRTFVSQGKWLGKVPRGYTLFGPKVTEEHRYTKVQRIEVNPDGKLLQEAFKWKLSGNYSDAMILKELGKKGLNIPKQTISNIWRNPFYCGVSTNSLLENEEAIKGNWEAIISTSDFLKLKKILEKNKSGYKHCKVDEFKPLNAFLKCHQCENKLTSYENKKKRLFYYKCNHCRGVSLNAITRPKSKNKGAEDLFMELLDKYKINQSFSVLIKTQMKKIYTTLSKIEISKQKNLKDKIRSLEKELNDLHIEYGRKRLSEKVYNLTVNAIEEDLLGLKADLKNTNPKLSNQDGLIDKSLESLQNMGKIWVSSTLEGKQALQNTLFPSGVFFDKENHTYLTKEVNSFLLVSNYISSTYEYKKNETFNQIDEKSHLVAGTGLEPVTFGL